MIFDLPHLSGNFSNRIMAMQRLIDESRSPYLAMVEQYKIANNRKLHHLLDDIVDNNGEGLMLHLADAEHQYGRSQNLLKLKKYQDAEAKVIAHVTGKGKYKNLLGAIQVITPDGIRFKIGSGFSDLQRQKPPKIGSTITYKYIGKTQRGVPRFASFLRMSNQH
jgi:DNA ligase 1